MGRSGSVRSLLAAAAAACIALAPASVVSQPAAAASRLEAHVWAHDGHPGPLAAGAADDFWTSSGSHYRFDGTKLGELQFSDRLAGKPEAIVSIRVGPRGQVFVAGIWPDLGFSLAAHDENGQQRWIRSLGRAGAKGSAKGPLRRGSQEEPSPKITSAEILGVDSEGDVQNLWMVARVRRLGAATFELRRVCDVGPSGQEFRCRRRRLSRSCSSPAVSMSRVAGRGPEHFRDLTCVKSRGRAPSIP